MIDVRHYWELIPATEVKIHDFLSLIQSRISVDDAYRCSATFVSTWDYDEKSTVHLLLISFGDLICRCTIHICLHSKM